MNPKKQRYMHDLYLKTVDREEYLENEGFIVESVWECQYEKELANNEEMKAYVDSLDIQDYINPRDAFYGGRTDAMKLFFEAPAGSKIHYYDFTR